jgi:hypothetical protein
MGGQPSIYLAYACAALAHFFAIGGRAHAQETDGQVLIGIGIAPLSVTSTTTMTEGAGDRSTTLARASLGREVLLAAGVGIGQWVLAIETAFAHSVTRQDQDDTASFDDVFVTKRSEITLGPSARFLFVEGALRPFVEVGAGFGVLTVDVDGVTDNGITLYVRGGGGLQLRLTDAASLDLALRAGYAATSGKSYSPQSGGRLNATTGLYQPGYPSSSLEYDVDQLSADIAARLSIWL